MIDYEFFLKQKIRYQKSYIEPNNPLQIYIQHQNKGIITFDATTKNTYQYKVKDTYGNLSSIAFPIVGNYHQRQKEPISYDTLFSYQDSNYFSAKNISVSIPKNALYKDLPFRFSKSAPLINTLSPIYYLHDEYTPLHKAINVAIKMEGLTVNEKQKAIVVYLDDQQHFSSLGGTWHNDVIEASAKKWGGFAVMLDTIAPKITPINIFKNKNMARNTTISIKIADDLSGIKSFSGTIDGKWAMMEYEAKKATIYHTFDALPKGKHTFELVLTDGVGNQSYVSIPFIR